MKYQNNLQLTNSAPVIDGFAKTEIHYGGGRKIIDAT
jgi:hypothetical protein